MLDTRPALTPLFTTLGVAATVTLAGGGPIPATLIWLTRPGQPYPVSAEMAVSEPRRIAAFRRDQVPSLPTTGTIIQAPERAGGPVKSFRVEGVEREDDEVIQVIVGE